MAKKKVVRKAPSKKMPEQRIERKVKSKAKNICATPGCKGAGYGLGFIGALVYYLTTATSFWMGLWGIIKACLWPAFLIYALMKNLGM